MSRGKIIGGCNPHLDRGKRHADQVIAEAGREMKMSLSGRPHPPKPDPSNWQKRRRRRPSHSVSRDTSFLLSLLDTLQTTRRILILILSLSLFNVTSAASNCLRFATYSSINQLFIDGGPGTKVFLCPSKTYRLSGTIVFTAADQEIATFGYPAGAKRAILKVAGDASTAAQGDCRRCARVAIKSLIIDGNRAKLGRIIDVDLATGLIVLGGNEGQVITNCWVKDPRGFTAIHIREGDRRSCTGAIIENNEIGPVGNEFDPEVDGPDPEMSPKGRPLADGLSIACRDSFVRDNTFYDNTDAAIVVYCSPGTLIHANRITANKLSAMAGILLVDSTPFDGDYTGTTIKANIIDAASRIIRVGIGLGAAVWSDDTDTILRGGTVLANGFKGKYLGYGIAAAGLEGWTIKDNWDEATHQGQRSARCFDEPINPSPVAFLQWSEKIADSALQPGFVDQEFQYVVCIDQEEDKFSPAKHDTPALPPREGLGEKPVAEGFATGSEVMDDILEHSLQRMLEAIEHLARKVDVLSLPGNEVESVQRSNEEAAALPREVAAALLSLAARVEALETRQRKLVDTALSMRKAMEVWDAEVARMNEWQSDLLLDVKDRLDLHLASESQANTPVYPVATARDRLGLATLTNRARILSGAASSSEGGSWGILMKFALAQGLVGIVVLFVRRWLRRRDHSKIL